MKKTYLPLLLVLSCIITSCKENATKSEQVVTKPNILIILADDIGFSDVEPFGGNISTPNLNSLAKESMLFSNFHVLPTCSPSRSALLTGNDNHIAGLGIMGEMDYPALHNLQLPGYSAELSNQVVTIPEVLRENGYQTYMTGKWHLGEGPGKDPFFRGFEETFILGTGGGSHFSDRKPLAPPQSMDYTRNGKVIDLPEDFYSSRNYTDSMIQFIENGKKEGKPFFGYLSYTSAHDPLHAPAEYIAKYKGKFDMGWDSLWTLRMKNLQALGIIPATLNKFSKNPAIPKWSSLSKKDQIDFARDMEVYAAMIDYMDMSIGRVLDYLKKSGQYENTMIIFMADNGANGATAHTYPGNEDGKYMETFNNEYNNRGLQHSYVEMGPGWAQASSAPYRFFKSFASEGGIKAPLIIKMPGKSNMQGKWNKSFLHVTDIMPTLLALTNSTYPEKRNEIALHPLIGKSLVPILQGDSTAVRTNEGMGWELFEMKAYIKGNWKILRLPKPFGTGSWQLYDLENDPAETTDLSEKYPELKASLIADWDAYAKHNSVYDHRGHFDSLYRKSFALDDD